MMETSASAPIPSTNTFSRDPRARELCRTMAAIHRRGWCDGTGGNFSVVLQRHPDLQLLMAPSGVDKGSVRPSQLILVNGEGEVIGGEGKVSAEMQLHRAIVLSTGAGAVLHTHSQAATLLSRLSLAKGSTATAETTQTKNPAAITTMTPGAGADADQGASGPPGVSHLQIEGLEMLKGLEGIHTHLCRIQIPVLANDQDLNRLSSAAEPHLNAAPHGILISGHGLYAWGENLAQARRHLEILEFLLEQTWRQRLWGAICSGPQP